MSFPDPPIYAKEYHAEAVKSGAAPPPPPVPKKFCVFGEEYDLETPYIPALTELGLSQVYSKCTTMDEYKAELKKLSSSIMVAFLDLVSILTRDPLSDERNKQFETLKMLFINIHHMINECRVVQARATLVTIQKEQNHQLETLIESFNNAKIDAIQCVKEASEIGEKYLEEKDDLLITGAEYLIAERDEKSNEAVIAELYSLDGCRKRLHFMPDGDTHHEILQYMEQKNNKKRKPIDKVVRLQKDKTTPQSEELGSDEAELYSRIKESLKLSKYEEVMENDNSNG